jgi:hypothetical protein
MLQKPSKTKNKMQTIEVNQAAQVVEAINALPVHEWVEVQACQFDESDEDFAGEVHVEIIPRFRAHGMKAEHELYCARIAAQADIEALPFVASLVSIGWVSSEGGVGESFRVILK